VGEQGQEKNGDPQAKDNCWEGRSGAISSHKSIPVGKSSNLVISSKSASKSIVVLSYINIQVKWEIKQDPVSVEEIRSQAVRETVQPMSAKYVWAQLMLLVVEFLSSRRDAAANSTIRVASMISLAMASPHVPTVEHSFLKV
jgi:hypothetical protein